MITTPERPISKSAKTPSLWLRILFSLFIVFHVFAIVTLANSGSYLGRSFWPVISNYGNAIGLNVTWNFFAPDPAHTMYIHYYAHFDEEGKEPIEGYIPPEKEQIVINSSERRFLYAMRFLILDEKRMKILLGPYLCRVHPGAASIHIENILEPIPNLDVSHLGEEMSEKQEAKMMEYTYVCGEESDEVVL